MDVIRRGRDKLRFWRRSYENLSPFLSASTVLRILTARELSYHGLFDRGRALAVRLRRPVLRIALRPAGSDLATFDEVIREEVYRKACEAAGAAQQVIDLGANIGLASIYFLTWWDEARVLSVEPHAGNAEILVENLRPWIESGRCNVVEAAVWNADGPLEPVVDASALNDAFRVQAPSPGTAGSITGLSMRALIEMTGSPNVDLLKVDIEGAESELLSGDLSWLRSVRCLAIEFHRDLRAETGFDQLVQEYGFQIVAEDDHTVVARSGRSGSPVVTSA
jgi:FkbM family methyltransferase